MIENINNKLYTPKEFLEIELKFGVSYDNPDFVNLCRLTIESIKDLQISTILDYGSGTSVYSSEALKAGYDVKSYEIWEEHKKYALEHNNNLKFIDKLETTDLLLSIEVWETLTNSEINSLFNTISPKYILFSSTSEVTKWDKEWGHINIKPQEEWIKLFASKGYVLLRNNNFPTNHSKIFIKI